MKQFLFTLLIIYAALGCHRREIYDDAVKHCANVDGRDYNGCIRQQMNNHPLN